MKINNTHWSVEIRIEQDDGAGYAVTGIWFEVNK